VERKVEIDVAVDLVYAQWCRWEEMPYIMDGVRRTKVVDAAHVLFDAEVAGRQVVWEAEIVERVPEKLIRWESRWGASNAGEVRFSAPSERRTQLSVMIEFEPRSWLGRVGAWLGLVGLQLQHDLSCFGAFVERAAAAGR
jgi:uncharacterized membrane protein